MYGPELVINGTDWTGASGSTPPTGWLVPPGSSTNTNFSVSSGIFHTESNNTSYPGLYQVITVEIGKTYTVTLVAKNYNFYYGVYLFLGTDLSAHQLEYGNVHVTETDAFYTRTTTFVATSTSFYLKLFPESNAANQYGWVDTISLKSVINPPTVSTSSVTNKTGTSMTLNGYISSVNGENANEIGFDYGETEAYGSSIVSSGSFAIGTFSLNVTGLTPGVPYYFRAKAQNSAGMGYGSTGVSGKKVACLGDSSDHGGTLTSTNQDDKFMVAGVKICAHGCSHSCPIIGHGTTSVSAIATHSYVNGKLIITTDATAGCGAKMTPPDRKLYIE